jgi:hypothetical protein
MRVAAFSEIAKPFRPFNCELGDSRSIDPFTQRNPVVRFEA